MAKRTNHYEAAFEEYLRRKQIAYVAVDEKKRALLADASLKSLDFIVSTPWGLSFLVDVKGRQFPSGGQKQYWKNWSTGDDMRSLTAWERIFGPSSQALLVFAYEVLGDQAPLPAEQLLEYRGRLYGFLGVRLGDYAAKARPISAKWETLAMPVRAFRTAAAPVEQFFCQTEPPERAELPEFDELGDSPTAEGLAMAGRW
jgi:hypothetical protein